jgi:hypothetical protein
MIKKFLSLILIAGLLVSSVAPSSSNCNGEKNQLTERINQCENTNKIYQTNVAETLEAFEKSQLNATYYKTKYENSQTVLDQCENEVLSNSRFLYWVAGKCIGMATLTASEISAPYLAGFRLRALVKYFLPIVIGASGGEIIYEVVKNEAPKNNRSFYLFSGVCIGMATFAAEKIFNAYFPAATPLLALIKHFLPIVVGAGIGEIVYKAAHLAKT